MLLDKDYRHSASKGNSFIDSPPHWIVHQLYAFEGKPNARMIMGTAAEAGAMNAIKNEQYEEDDIHKFTQKTFLELGGTEEDDEYEMTAKIAVRFKDTLIGFGDIVSYQKELQVSGEPYGLKYDIKCVTDFEFKDFIVDTKATAYLKRLKSGQLDKNWYPKQSDLRQQFLYKDIFKKPTMLLYCSHSDTETVELEHLEEDQLAMMIQTFKTIEFITSIAKTKEDIVRMYPLTLDNFRWGKGDTELKQFAKDIWQKAWK